MNRKGQGYRCATGVLVILALALPLRAQDDPALEQFFVANSAYNRKIYPVAITQFEEFLRRHGDHEKADQARYGLALSRYAMKQYDKAMPLLRELLEKKELDKAVERDRLFMLQGQCLLRSGKTDEALKLLVQAVDTLKPGVYRTGAMAGIADLHFREKRWKEAIEWAGRVLESKPEPAQASRALYQQGYGHYRLGQIDAAAGVLTRLQKEASAPAWKTRASYLLGECHASAGKPAEAEAAYAAALEGLKGADAAECLFRVATARFLLEKFDQASADFQKYVKDKGPRSREANLFIGRCDLERKDYKQAERKLGELAREKDELAARATLWWARVFSRQGNYDRASDILGEATRRFGRTAVVDDLNFDCASALMNRKQPEWKKAVEHFRRVEGKETFPQRAEVLSQVAVCHHRLKDYEQSLRYSERFLETFGDHALAGDVRFMIGENLYLMNRGDEAEQKYAEFIAKHPEHPNRAAAAYRRAQILHDRGKWPEALAAARPLLAGKPEGRLFEQLSFLVGDALFRQEKWAECVTPMEEFLASYIKRKGKRVSVDRGQNVDTALIQLAVAYDYLDKPAEALVHLKTLVNTFSPKDTPHLPLALVEQGRLAYASGDLKLARQALQRFLEYRKQNEPSFRSAAAAEQHARAVYYLGWVESGEDRHEEAAKRFGEMARQYGSHELASDAALQQGISLIHAGNFEAAAKQLPEILKRYPDHPELARLIYNTGLAYARIRNWRSAAGYFRRVIEQHPKAEFADRALYEWAWCERSMKRMKEAAERYERFIADYPASPLVAKVHSELAELNLDAGVQDKVIAKLTTTLDTVKDEALREDIRYQLATAHFRKGDHGTSAAMFEKLAADYPKSERLPSILFQAGESRLKLHESIPARDHYLKASQLKGKVAPAIRESILMRLGETQTMTGRFAEAAKTYKSFVDRHRESAWLRNAQFGLAYALQMQGNSKKALEEYRRLVVLPSGGAPKGKKKRNSKKPVKQADDLWQVRARFQMGECHFDLREYDRAVAEFVNVDVNFKAWPDWRGKAVLEMGRVLIAQKKYEEARATLRDCIQRFGKEKAAVVARQLLDEIRNL